MKETLQKLLNSINNGGDVTFQQLDNLKKFRLLAVSGNPIHARSMICKYRGQKFYCYQDFKNKTWIVENA